MIVSLKQNKRLANRGSSLSGTLLARQRSRSRQVRPGRHPATASLVLACWNVHSLGILSDHNLLLHVSLQWSTSNLLVCALSETWITGSGSIYETNFSFFWSGYSDNARPTCMHGVGLAIQNSMLPCTQQPVSLSPRLMSMRMRLSSGFVTVIYAYAPTQMADSVEKDEFYQLLDDTLLSIPAGDSIVLTGDFNVCIRSDYRSWWGVIGSSWPGQFEW